MATIRTAISVYDGVTGPLQSMRKAMNIVLNSFEAMQSASGNSVDVSAIKEAREELARVETAFDGIEQKIKDAEQEQHNFNNTLGAASPAADALGGKLKGILATVVSIAGIKSALGWVKENLDLSDTQRNAETQLMAVLKTVGATEDAFNSLKEAAANVQSKGIYGDEIMLGGAAEFATYMTDPKAIESMMGTLANYAMGMSGGGEIDYNSMVDYATQLGKALNGTFDGLKKKGFELTDAQKKIIENGTDMQKALVLEDVIAESWDGLYETMSQTPEGKIIQFKNRFGDLREELGDRLYGVVIRVFDAFDSHFDQISSMMYGLADAAGVLVGLLGLIAEFALNVGQAFTDNWSWIEPIVWGLVAAMTAYAVISGVVAAVNGIHAASEGIKAAAQMMATGATFAETAAQYGLNAALMACPVFWVVAGVLALIVAIVAVVRALNIWGSQTHSVLGTITGLFMVAVAFIGNLFIALINLGIDVFAILWNFIGAFANFFANVFNDPIGSIVRLFADMGDTVLSILQSLASAIDTVFGSNLSGAVQGWRDGLKGAVESTFGKGEEVWENIDPAAMHLDRFEYGAAFELGAEFGDGISDKIGGIFDFTTPDFDTATTWDSIAGNTGDTANNTAKTSDTLDYMDEDLKYMRDLAEREAINRFTTAEITVNQENNNYIDSETDLDGIMDAWTEAFAEKLEVSAAGVHDDGL